MKAKLLKKTRKRFSIIYREKPYMLYGFIESNYKLAERLNLYKRFDLARINTNKEEDILLSKTKENCLNHIIETLKKEHPNLGVKNKKLNKETKVWYN